MRPIAFRGIEVFDGSRFIGARTVVIADGVIASLDEDPPGDADVFDGAGRTLLPGFIDTHVHIGFFSPAEVLRGGITTARDLGWPLARMRALADAGDGPDLLYAGPILTPPGGYPSRAGWAPRGTALEVSPSEIAETVAGLARAGAAVIKVAQSRGPVFSPDALGQIVASAHEVDLPVASHLDRLDQLEVAIDAGVDELAHGLWSDDHVHDETLSRMTGMVVLPTLHIDPSPARIETTRRFLGAGGRVIYGTDMGNAPVPPGIDVAELELMRSAGMTLEEVLASATSRAAALLKLADRGRIAPGARADLVAIEGDPRASLVPLGAPLLVVRAGVPARG